MSEDLQGVVREHGRLVWRTVYRLLGNEADAADCMQATFISALEVAAKRQVISWPALLQHIATRRALDLLRKRKHSRAAEPLPDDLAAGAPGPGERLVRHELREQLLAAIAMLPEQQASVLCLRYLNDLSYGEIATELGISTDLVGVSLTRARAKLRELLGEYFQDGTEVNHAR